LPRGRAHRIRPSSTCTQATVSIITRSFLIFLK
jgi:hypothetical protein